ncbi:MAG: hypothetical protein LQ343_007903, partial [Gyalolechia ehrenbergii]
MARRDYYDPDTLSDALRQEGNVLYRANLLQEGIRCYTIPCCPIYPPPTMRLLPRYLPTLRAGTEHYVVGHDDACQQVNDVDRIPRTIKRAVAAIQSGEDLLPWGDLKSAYSVSEITRLLVHYFRGEERVRVQQNRPDKYRKECKLDSQQYKETGALWAASFYGHEITNMPKVACGRDNARRWMGQGSSGYWLTGVMSFDPFRILVELYEYSGLQPPKDASSLYDFVISFFLQVAHSLKSCHGLLDREKSCAQSYDRIHLSNIPDYIVGPLASILFAVSLLKPVSEAVVTANCLRNTPIWDNVHQSPCEYLAVGDRDTINKLMQVIAQPQQRATTMDGLEFPSRS